MGLDMYLKKERWYSSDNPEFDQLKGIISDPDTESITVRTDFLQWRGAHAIHDWFVNHVQDGMDNYSGVYYYVSRDTLIELLDILRKITKDPDLAPDLLSCDFGGDFDADYWDDVRYTREALEKEKLDEDKDYDYVYSSSW